MTVNESLSGLLRRLDLEVYASIYAMDLARDDMDEIERLIQEVETLKWVLSK